MNGNCRASGKCCCMINAALFVLRLALAIIFIFHGYGKIWGNVPQGGMETFIGIIQGLGFPAPAFFAWLVAIVELVGGIALLLGVLSRYMAVLLAIIMAVSFFTVKVPMGWLPAGDVDLALFAIAVAVALMGPGAWALMTDCCGKMCMGKCGKKKEAGSMPMSSENV